MRLILLKTVIGTLLAGSFCLPLLGQVSTFDAGNEGWTAIGDPTSTTAAWLPAGGNPGGHIEVTDASTGGTWYFVAPAKFGGNKCDAYGKYLRYDQRTSDTANQQAYGGNPDIVLESPNLTLIFDNAVNPGLEWTHYDVLLQENGGWHVGILTGPVPTTAQFQQVLSSLSELRIRGEYRAQADIGSLDNVILESNFNFDLDGDDSSGASNGEFRGDTLCSASSAMLLDGDAVLVSEKKIDSVRVQVLFANALEIISFGALPSSITVQNILPGRLTLVNGGTATPADFLIALKSLNYADASLHPLRGVRIIGFHVFTDCGEMALRYAYLPLFPVPDAGLNGDTILCAGASPIDLSSVLKGTPDPGGFWSPATASNLFDPAKDKSGTYTYIIPDAGVCPGDTANVGVTLIPSFRLRPDTTLCAGDTLLLNIPAGLSDWIWSDGSRQAQLPVTAAGLYTLSGQLDACAFTDSVQVNFYTCETCPFYAPNIFSPNDDGENDEFQVFMACAVADFHLEIYDRWGNLVFKTDNPDARWDGKGRSKEPVAGVYAWWAEWSGELMGEKIRYRKRGDVTILK